MLPLLATAALAWSPTAHHAMAARAAALDADLAGGPTATEAAAFARAAAAEDVNLVRKWSRWHHYWTAEPLAWRRPSPERVSVLTEAIEAALAAGDRADAWRLAGLLAHHVQDMASPPHVIPVHHGLGDGFEGYPTAGLIAVAGVSSPPDLPASELQSSLVARTSAALREPLACDDLLLDPSDLWIAEPGGFGRLGALRFGDVPGCEAAFDAFARARVEDAVAWSRAVVRWVAASA